MPIILSRRDPAGNQRRYYQFTGNVDSLGTYAIDMAQVNGLTQAVPVPPTGAIESNISLKGTVEVEVCQKIDLDGCHEPVNINNFFNTILSFAPYTFETGAAKTAEAWILVLAAADVNEHNTMIQSINPKSQYLAVIILELTPGIYAIPFKKTPTYILKPTESSSNAISQLLNQQVQSIARDHVEQVLKCQADTMALNQYNALRQIHHHHDHDHDHDHDHHHDYHHHHHDYHDHHHDHHGSPRIGYYQHEDRSYAHDQRLFRENPSRTTPLALEDGMSHLKL